MKFVRRTYYSIFLFLLFLWDLTASSVAVARAVLSPRIISKPRLVTVPLTVTTDTQITLVANFISLTPGTLSIDVSPDRKTLLVHDLFAGDDSAPTRASVRDGIEARVFEATAS